MAVLGVMEGIGNPLIATKKQFIFAMKNRSGITPKKGEQTVLKIRHSCT